MVSWIEILLMALSSQLICRPLPPILPRDTHLQVYPGQQTLRSPQLSRTDSQEGIRFPTL